MSSVPRCASSPRSRLSETFKRDTRADWHPSQGMTAPPCDEDYESTRTPRIPSPNVGDRIHPPSPPRQHYRSVDPATSAGYRRGDPPSRCDHDPTSRERNQNDTAPIPPSLSTHQALRINHHGVENVPVGPTSIRTARCLPHIHITASSLPVARTTIPHLLRYMRFYQPRQVLMDDEGYYILFEDTFFGRKRLHACHCRSNMQLFFRQYRLHMVRYPDGLGNSICPVGTEDDSSNRTSTSRNAVESQPEPGNITAPIGSSDTPEKSVQVEVEARPVASHESHSISQMPAELINLRHTASAPALPMEDSSGDTFTSAPSTTTARHSSRQDLDDEESISDATAVSNMSTTRIKKCHVCKKSTDLDRMAQCQSCPRIYHTRCHRWQPSPTQTRDVQTWSCYRCVKRKFLKAADGGQALSANSVATTVDPAIDVLANNLDPSHQVRHQRLETDSCRIQPVECSLPVADEVSLPASPSLTSNHQPEPRPLNTSFESTLKQQASLSNITSLKTSRRLSLEQPVIEDLFLDDVLDVAGNNEKSAGSEVRSEAGRSQSAFVRTKLSHAGSPNRKNSTANDSAELSRKSASLTDTTTGLTKNDQALVEQTHQAPEPASDPSRMPEPSINKPNAATELNPKQNQASSAKATAKRTKAKIQLCATCHGALPPFHLSSSCRKCEVKEVVSRIEIPSSVNTDTAGPASPSPAVAHSHATTSRRLSDVCLVAVPNENNSAKEPAGSRTEDNGAGTSEITPVNLPAQQQQQPRVKQQTAKSRAKTFTTKSLILMSMSDAPGYRVQCSDVCTWIARNIPDMKRGTGRWEQNVSAILSQNMDTGNGLRPSHLWVRSYGEDNRSAWYTLRADLRNRTEQWDPVLQEQVPPSPAMSLQVEGQSHGASINTSHDTGKDRECARERGGIRKKNCAAPTAGVNLKRKPSHTSKLNTEPAHIDDGSSSSSEPIRMRVKRRKVGRTAQHIASRSCSRSSRSSLKDNIISDSRERNAIGSDQANRQEQAVQYQSSSEDEPIACSRLKRDIRLKSSARTASAASPEPLTPLLTDNDTHIKPYPASSAARSAEQDHVNPNLYRSGNSKISAPRSEGSGSSRIGTPKISSRAVKELDRLSNPSAKTVGKRSNWNSTTSSCTLIHELMLRGSFQTEAPDTEYSVRSFFEEYPEYHVTYPTSRAARQVEISNRLSRKQLFKKPAAYSLLADNDFGKNSSILGLSNSPRQPRDLDETPFAPRQSVFNSSFAGNGSRTETIFQSVDGFFDISERPLPVTYRDGSAGESQLA